MSESATTHTKTLSESADSDSTDSPLRLRQLLKRNASRTLDIADRWTNNITYRQLVVSSCIGILQLWWHPYIHDLRRLLPFLFLYNVFSVIVGYPMFYLELALGVVTRKGVIAAWDIAPIVRGVGFTMLIICAATALAASAAGAWALALLVHSAHGFLPWLPCAAAARPACAARHRPLGDSEPPAQSFFFNFVLALKREGLTGGLGDVAWELAAYFVVCWALVYLVAVKRIYSYSKLVLFKDVLAYFVLVCCAVGCARLEGAGRMFQECDWAVLLEGTQMWREAIEYCLLEMAVGQGTLVMLGAHCPQQQTKLSTTAALAFLASKTCCMGSVLVLGATHGALLTDYDTNRSNIWRGPAAPMILWADFVARVPGSQFWSALVFFTLLVLSISFVALMVHTIISTFTGRSIRSITWAFLILICCLFCTIGIITLCTQGGLYILTFLLEWPAARPRAAAAAAAAGAVTFVYGQTTFCEDVYFAVGEYPCLFVRVCWAVAPFILMLAFSSSAIDGAGAGWAVTGAALLPAAVVAAAYLLFKCRVRNIVRSEK